MDKKFTIIVTTLMFLAMAALVVGIRLWMASGNWACVMSADPILCNIVSNLS